MSDGCARARESTDVRIPPASVILAAALAAANATSERNLRTQPPNATSEPVHAPARSPSSTRRVRVYARPSRVDMLIYCTSIRDAPSRRVSRPPLFSHTVSSPERAVILSASSLSVILSVSHARPAPAKESLVDCAASGGERIPSRPMGAAASEGVVGGAYPRRRRRRHRRRRRRRRVRRRRGRHRRHIRQRRSFRRRRFKRHRVLLATRASTRRRGLFRHVRHGARRRQLGRRRRSLRRLRRRRLLRDPRLRPHRLRLVRLVRLHLLLRETLLGGRRLEPRDSGQRSRVRRRLGDVQRRHRLGVAPRRRCRRRGARARQTRRVPPPSPPSSRRRRRRRRSPPLPLARRARVGGGDGGGDGDVLGAGGRLRRRQLLLKSRDARRRLRLRRERRRAFAVRAFQHLLERRAAVEIGRGGERKPGGGDGAPFAGGD